MGKTEWEVSQKYFLPERIGGGNLIPCQRSAGKKQAAIAEGRKREGSPLRTSGTFLGGELQGKNQKLIPDPEHLHQKKPWTLFLGVEDEDLPVSCKSIFSEKGFGGGGETGKSSAESEGHRLLPLRWEKSKGVYILQG